MRLLVTAAALLGDATARDRPDALLTIGSPGRPRPAGPPGTPHLHLAFNDTAAPAPGLVPPERPHIERLLAFGREGRTVLLVCCEYGVSRSPAAAFALACQARPDLDPGELARRLRAASAQATPNPLVVALADAILGRGGAMTDAIRAIGRGREYRGPEPFGLDLAGGRPAWNKGGAIGALVAQGETGTR